MKVSGLRWNGGRETGEIKVLLNTMKGGPNKSKIGNVLTREIVFPLHWIRLSGLQGKLILSLSYVFLHSARLRLLLLREPERDP